MELKYQCPSMHQRGKPDTSGVGMISSNRSTLNSPVPKYSAPILAARSVMISCKVLLNTSIWSSKSFGQNSIYNRLLYRYALMFSISVHCYGNIPTPEQVLNRLRRFFVIVAGFRCGRVRLLSKRDFCLLSDPRGVHLVACLREGKHQLRDNPVRLTFLLLQFLLFPGIHEFKMHIRRDREPERLHPRDQFAIDDVLHEYAILQLDIVHSLVLRGFLPAALLLPPQLAGCAADGVRMA